MMTRTPVDATALLLALCFERPPLAAQPKSFVGAEAVASVTHEDVQQALFDAGVREVTDQTADPNLPTFGGVHSQGISLQATLYACDVEAERCRGVELHSVIPTTMLSDAQLISTSIEISAFGIDAQVLDLPNEPDSSAVMISSYLVYDYGVSDRLLTIALEQLTTVIDQTKAFMLQKDPAHVELWAGQD